jgi:hypothetical protein
VFDSLRLKRQIRQKRDLVLTAKAKYPAAAQAV